jgi:putative tryptophan/tyrosine transport system substrate-binding protein
MRRQDFIALAGATATAWPLAARAQQQPERQRQIGILLTLTKDNPDGQARVNAFRQGLESLGWRDGRNIRIDERWPGEDGRALNLYAAELVKLNPDAVMVGGSRALIAIQQQTQTIPIVFVAAAGTVEHGIVTSAAGRKEI